MRTKKVLFNFITEFLVQMLTIIYGFVITKMIIQSYGSSMNGLIASISQILGQFRLIEMGLGGAIIFALYAPIAANDSLMINNVATTGKSAYFQVAKYFSILLIALALLYPIIVEVNELSYTGIMGLILIMGSSTLFVFFYMSKYNVLIVASQKSYILNISKMIYTIINLSLMYGLVFNKVNVLVVYLSALIATIIQFIFIRYIFRKQFSSINFKGEYDAIATNKRFDVMLHQISGVIVFNTPIVLLSLLSTLIDVSIYSVYMLIFSGINLFLGIFSNGFMAGFGNLLTSQDKNTLKIAYKQYEYLYYIVTAIIYSAVIILINPFMKLYTVGIQDAEYTSWILGVLFVIIGVLNNWKIPQSVLINAAGHFRETRHRAIIEAVIALGAGILLVQFYGIIGVLIASICGLLYRSIDLFYINRFMDDVVRSTCLRLIRLIVFVIAATCISHYLNNQFIVENFYEWIVYAIVVTIIITIIILCFNYIFDKKEMRLLYNRIKNIIRK